MAVGGVGRADPAAVELDNDEHGAGAGAGVAAGAVAETYESFFRAYAPRVAGFLRATWPGHATLDDLVQETLLRAYRAKVYAAPRGDPWPWLKTVARNLAIDRARRRSRSGEVLVDDEAFDEVPVGRESLFGVDVRDDPEEILLGLQRSQEVAETLAAMEPSQRRLLLRKYVEGMDYEQIGAAEDTPVTAIHSALDRARKRFRNAYFSVTEGEGFGAVVGLAFGPLFRRLRVTRARWTGDDWTTAISGNAGAIAPGLFHSVAAAATFGAAALGALAVETLPAAPVDAAATTLIAAELPGAVELESPVVNDFIDALPVSTGDEPAQPVVDRRPADPSPERDEIRPLAPPASVAVKFDEAAPVAEPPAGGGATAMHDEDGVKSSDELSVDLDGDGERDPVANGGANASCPRPERRGLVGNTACPLVQEGRPPPPTDPHALVEAV